MNIDNRELFMTRLKDAVFNRFSNYTIDAKLVKEICAMKEVDGWTYLQNDKGIKLRIRRNH